MQSINPITSFFSPSGGQFGLVNVTVGQSSAPEVEKDLLSDVGSYGKQIGQIPDALLAVIEHPEARRQRAWRRQGGDGSQGDDARGRDLEGAA